MSGASFGSALAPGAGEQENRPGSARPILPIISTGEGSTALEWVFGMMMFSDNGMSAIRVDVSMPPSDGRVEDLAEREDVKEAIQQKTYERK